MSRLRATPGMVSRRLKNSSRRHFQDARLAGGHDQCRHRLAVYGGHLAYTFPGGDRNGGIGIQVAVETGGKATAEQHKYGLVRRTRLQQGRSRGQYQDIACIQDVEYGVLIGSAKQLHPADARAPPFLPARQSICVVAPERPHLDAGYAGGVNLHGRCRIPAHSKCKMITVILERITHFIGEPAYHRDAQAAGYCLFQGFRCWPRRVGEGIEGYARIRNSHGCPVQTRQLLEIDAQVDRRSEGRGAAMIDHIGQRFIQEQVEPVELVGGNCMPASLGLQPLRRAPQSAGIMRRAKFKARLSQNVPRFRVKWAMLPARYCQQGFFRVGQAREYRQQRVNPHRSQGGRNDSAVIYDQRHAAAALLHVLGTQDQRTYAHRANQGRLCQVNQRICTGRRQ